MANNSGKGPQFEYLLCEMFAEQDYFARRSIPIMLVNGQDVTDIDVLGIKFIYPFEKKMLICDCKNKAKSKPFERIFWTKGLGTYVGVDEEYVALPKANGEIISFAKQCGVRVIVQEELSKYGKANRGYADYNFLGELFKNIEDKKNGDLAAARYLSILKKEYLSDNPYKSLNVALLILNKLSKEKLGEDGVRMVYAEGVTVVAYSLLDICHDVFGMGSADRDRYIEKKLTYGDSDESYIENLVNSITMYANEVLAGKIPKEYYNKNLVDKMVIPKPHYAKNCISIVEKAYSSPSVYIDILQNLDFIMFEFFVKKKAFDENIFAEHCRNFRIDDKLKACKNILFFIGNSSAVFLNDIWTEEPDFIPQKRL